MKKYYKEYSKSWKEYPMAFWVHKSMNDIPWYDSDFFDPPAPKPNLNGLFTIYCVEYDGIILKFSSIYQYDDFLNVLSQKMLPQTINLSNGRKTSRGPNTHWLSKLPKKVKSWKFRNEMVNYLKANRKRILE